MQQWTRLRIRFQLHSGGVVCSWMKSETSFKRKVLVSFNYECLFVRIHLKEDADFLFQKALLAHHSCSALADYRPQSIDDPDDPSLKPSNSFTPFRPIIVALQPRAGLSPASTFHQATIITWKLLISDICSAPTTNQRQSSTSSTNVA